jgi:hypothetical protein
VPTTKLYGVVYGVFVVNRVKGEPHFYPFQAGDSRGVVIGKPPSAEALIKIDIRQRFQALDYPVEVPRGRGQKVVVADERRKAPLVQFPERALKRRDRAKRATIGASPSSERGQGIVEK